LGNVRLSGRNSKSSIERLKYVEIKSGRKRGTEGVLSLREDVFGGRIEKIINGVEKNGYNIKRKIP